MFKICLENRLTLRENDYKCYLCHCQIPKSDFDLVLNHILLNEHKTRINQINEAVRKQESDKLSTISESQRKKIVQNQITCLKSSGLFKCHICKFQIIGLTNVIEHVKDTLHSNKIKSLRKNVTKQTSRNSSESSEIKLQSHFIEMHYCIPCHVHLKNTTMLQCHVMLHLHRDYNLSSLTDIIKYSFINEKCIIKCVLCNSFISNDELLHEHLKTDIHLDRLKLLESDGYDFKSNSSFTVQLIDNVRDRKKFYAAKDLLVISQCVKCKVSVAKNKMPEHICANQQVLSGTSKTNADKLYCAKSEMDNSKYYTCFMCELAFCNMQSLIGHYKTHGHQNKIKSFQMIYKSSYMNYEEMAGKQIIYCSLCKSEYHNSSSAAKHISNEKHKKQEVQNETSLSNEKKYMTKNINMDTQGTTNISSNKHEIAIVDQNQTNVKVLTAKKRDEFQTSCKELIELGFSPQNAKSIVAPESESIDNVLNNLKLDMSQPQQRQLFPSVAQRKPRIPKTKQEEISSFERNISIFGEKFIILCIDPGKDNIYSIDHEKICLMKLGVLLTIPWESERVCLPCGVKFPNDKNFLFEHLKNQEHIQNLQEMKINDRHFEKFPDQFSDLKLAKSYMKESSENVVQCYVCNIDIENENYLIHSHFNNADHIVKSRIWTEMSNEIISDYSEILEDLWYYAQIFVCNVCEKKFDFEIDFVIHLQDCSHSDKVNQLRINNILLCFDGCPACITYWFGESNSYILHCEDQFHKCFVVNKDLIIPDMTIAALEFLENVDEKVYHLMKESDKVAHEIQNEENLSAAIKNTIKPAYPKTEVYIYGSRPSGLGFPDCNVDIFIDCENVYYKSTTQEQSQYYLSTVKKYFENESNIWTIDKLLLVTKIPIIKLLHIPTGLRCEISFNNGLNVEKSQLIGFYNSAYPMCAEMILYLKKWLKLSEIFGTDCLTTYAISWYVIFYLQGKGILPTVCDLIIQKNKSKLVDGWECGFEETIQARDCSENFQEHLKGFFSYFADFDYHKNVACPYVGKVIEKRDFAYYHQLPNEMEIYKNRLKNNKACIFRFDSPMCIQDPIDLSCNITFVVKKQKLRYFRKYCKESYKKL